VLESPRDGEGLMQERGWYRHLEIQADPHKKETSPPPIAPPSGLAIPRVWARPPQDSVARPSSSMAAWEELVRSRDEDTIAVEIAVPQDRLATLRQFYGNDLERASEPKSVKIKVHNTVREGEVGEQLGFVTISGRPLEAERARSAVMWAKNDIFYAKRVSYLADMESFFRGVHPRNVRPVHSMEPWTTAVRSYDRAENQAVIETVIPSLLWEKEIKLEQEPRFHDLSLEVGPPFHAEPPSSSGVVRDAHAGHKHQELRALQISGKYQKIYRAHLFLMKLRDSTLASQNLDADATAAAPSTTASPSTGSPLPVGPAPSVSSHVVPTHYIVHTHRIVLRVEHPEGALWATKRRLARLAEGTGCFFVRIKKGLIHARANEISINRVVQLLQQMLDKAATANGWEEPAKVEVVSVASFSGLTPANVEDTAENSKAGQADLLAPRPNKSISPTDLTEDLKMVLRPLTHPVVLITSRMPTPIRQILPSSSERLKFCRGVTVSSFTTVTMTPKPVITFNLKVPSRTWEAIESSQRLCVHVLAATPEAAALAHAFTLPHAEPHTPFQMVGRMGAAVSATHQVPSQATSQSVLVRKPGAVLSYIHARLSHTTEKQCLRVGDHVVVVAEVESVELAAYRDQIQEAVGLAYSRRGYRGLGPGLHLPAMPSLEGSTQMEETTGARRDALREAPYAEPERNTSDKQKGDISSSQADSAAQSAAVTAKASFRTISEDPDPQHGDEFDDAPFADDNSAANVVDTDSEKLANQGAKSQGPRPSAARKNALAEEDDYDLGFAQPERSPDPPGIANPYDSSARSKHTLPVPVAPISGEESGSNSLSRNKPWGLQGSARNFSTSARRVTSRFTRHYSGSSKPQHNGSRYDISTAVSDPELLSQTVGDFLGMPNEWQRPHNMGSKLKAKSNAEVASLALARGLAEESLTAEESLRLRRTVASNERQLAKKLALQAALDLRIMLDEGRLDFRRAQYMEQSIEQGLAVVAEEVGHVKTMLDTGQIDFEVFEKATEKLKSDHEALDTEVMRMRQRDEDDE